VRKVKNAKKRTDKFQEGLSPSCEESKECKETDKQILEEGRCCCMRKSKECKETDRQIPEEACRRRGKERKEVPGLSTASEEEDLGFMTEISATSEEEDPGSMPGISAATEEEGGPEFHTRDLQRRYNGEGRRTRAPDPGSSTRRSQW
jgi:hypothetical protein